MPIEFVADGVGDPHYLVFDPDEKAPWIASSLHELIDNVRSFDVATVFLLTPQTDVEEVHVESTDGDPDYYDWEVTLREGGDLVERAEYDPDSPQDFGAANRTVNVNGFQS